MNESWMLFSNNGDTDEELKEIFGQDAVIDRVGKYNLIHLDNPNDELRAQRKEEFNPDDLFEDDCPLCQMLREQGGNVVYDQEL